MISALGHKCAARLGASTRQSDLTLYIKGDISWQDRQSAAFSKIRRAARRYSPNCNKVRVASGAVRIRKQVVSEQQSIDVPVSHEELVIERHAVTDGAVGGTIGADETITVPLSREEVKVGKQTFVTEEVEVGKKAVGGVEHVSDTVRHEELVVDDQVKSSPQIR